ncbi:PQQ-dependent dehydrogenase, methanol/ethanol family [Methylobacterium frigidaeris]|uniref:Quinohemoprotein alcohol dehydrogenase ADH IIB n=3 Tax=Methylobacterium frigidaeris TaxID=2038277 RepID=A0AA37M383_9HYPH|nr:PQQ-dependent dehydrogenase, methanol/ethanol family [Methylobacterium frigidaeris]GJD60489.1 Quinohemoprotein alcohol dehydrogenase ADH IIB [Methylobacterium frigidaeris]
MGTIARYGFVCAALLLGAGPPAAAQAPKDAASGRAAGSDRSWTAKGGDAREWHYSPHDRINPDTIPQLKLAWYGDFETNRGQEATPIMVDGVLYTSTSWSHVYAYDAATGRQLWHYDPKVPGEKAVDACCDVVNRGVAASDGRIYVGAIDGRLIALDARTGQALWSVQTTDTTRPYTITGAPRVAKGKVLIGNGGAELGVRGYVSAYDAATGTLAWRFYTTPNPEDKADGAASDDVLKRLAAPTWGNGLWRKTGGGGTAWDAIVHDAEFNQILIGTGNGSPWNARLRSGPEGGDNLFLSSVVAVDADTGAYKWHYQETPGEDWDFTATQPILLTDLTVGGKPRKVALHAPKNGFFYVIDRETGKLVSARNFTPVNWAAGIDLQTGRPIEFPEARFTKSQLDFLAMPAAFGSHNWHPMAFSPKTGLVYLPTQELPFGYADDKGFSYTPGHGMWNLGVASTQNGGPTSAAHQKTLKAQTRGQLVAWDPVAQREVWRVQHSSVGGGGVLATGGNLVFQGMPDGSLRAYEATTGRKVWSAPGYSGIIAAPMSYEINGEQHIAVLAGYGGANGLHVPYIDDVKIGQTGRLLVFKLGGTATLPDNEVKPQPASVAVDDFAPGMVAKGGDLFGANCLFCHGFAAWSNGVVPDLRRSQINASKDGWRTVILDGVLKDRGMISFKDRLSDQDIEAIRAYIQDRARQLARDEALEAQARTATAGQ